MTQLSREAARAKYLYNRKYQDRYWEKKAAAKRTATRSEGVDGTVSVSRMGKTDERYIADLEQSNKVLNRENRRLVRLLHGYQTMIGQSTKATQ